jgi:hypothetical protein
MKELEKHGGQFHDNSGFSVTKHRDIAEDYARGRALERGGKPLVIETSLEELQKRGVRPVTGTGLTEAGEMKILPSDFGKVGPGVFKESNP